MTSRDFCFWLQGIFEVGKPEALNAEATAIIKAHLSLVFKHEIDPSMGGKKQQDALNALHYVTPANSTSIAPGNPVMRC